MSEPTPTTECQHGPCTCRHELSKMIEIRGLYFCSQTCAAADAAAESCECGHEDCDG